MTRSSGTPLREPGMRQPRRLAESAPLTRTEDDVLRKGRPSQTLFSATRSGCDMERGVASRQILDLAERKQRIG
jgi:hypothetical protein